MGLSLAFDSAFKPSTDFTSTLFASLGDRARVLSKALWLLGLESFMIASLSSFEASLLLLFLFSSITIRDGLDLVFLLFGLFTGFTFKVSFSSKSKCVFILAFGGGGGDILSSFVVTVMGSPKLAVWLPTGRFLLMPPLLTVRVPSTFSFSFSFSIICSCFSRFSRFSCLTGFLLFPLTCLLFFAVLVAVVSSKSRCSRSLFPPLFLSALEAGFGEDAKAPAGASCFESIKILLSVVIFSTTKPFLSDSFSYIGFSTMRIRNDHEIFMVTCFH
mmetsp:Transcript_5964/g.7103  ORF Transcript_5964/g.7103 Transcript_5964/m.7103 type:complete len:273 (-) Transcript_5964:461-1279(-)